MIIGGSSRGSEPRQEVAIWMKRCNKAPKQPNVWPSARNLLGLAILIFLVLQVVDIRVSILFIHDMVLY